MAMAAASKGSIFGQCLQHEAPQYVRPPLQVRSAIPDFQPKSPCVHWATDRAACLPLKLQEIAIQNNTGVKCSSVEKYSRSACWKPNELRTHLRSVDWRPLRRRRNLA